LSPLHDYTLAEIKKMKKAELVALAETLGVDSDGVKAEILERVLANQA
jgi:hypothetical protein